METIAITERDLRTLERLSIKRRSDCLAAFSVSEKGEIWMYAARGWTKLEQRECAVTSTSRVGRPGQSYGRKGSRQSPNN